MNIVITMAGQGSRFKKAGYILPKYMIEVKGKTLFEWSMESLYHFRSPSYCYYFVVKRDDNARDFINKICAQIGIRNYHILEIDHPTKGQAETVMMVKGLWDSQKPLLVYNIDTYIEPEAMQPEEFHGDGYIPCFDGQGDHWSFVRLNESGKVVEIREKKRISNHCTVGAYYFKSAELFQTLYRELYITHDYLEAGEQYIAPMYGYLLRNQGQIYISDIPSDKVHVLGTPEEVHKFEASEHKQD